MDVIIVWIAKRWSKLLLWLGWMVLTAAIVGLYLPAIQGKNINDLQSLQPDSASYGHHQIIEQCDLCHVPGGEIKEKACQGCHKAELKRGKDSHAVRKFLDPRNASRLEKIDVRKCSMCHSEHRPGVLDKGGVSIANDSCIHCHDAIAQERPTHKSIGFDRCVDCHNYHDNRALHEKFLAKHLDEPDTRSEATVPDRNYLELFKKSFGRKRDISELNAEDADQPAELKDVQASIEEWARSRHAAAGVNCSDCHSSSKKRSRTKSTTPMDAAKWVAQPERTVCRSCHRSQVKGFLTSHHGMRNAVEGMSPLTPEQAVLPMKSERHGEEIDCATCHDAHGRITPEIGVDTCLTCHDDDHSRAYLASPHGRLWSQEQAGQGAPGTGVTCATCHFPRVPQRKRRGVVHNLVQHNPSGTLRPWSKMVREVCLECHGLGFSMNALFDQQLAADNFNRAPGSVQKSLDLLKQKQNQKR
ncbi:MAG: cytochrome c3 family protein [Magnetococcales bacterium]|nr:cytochrome c3 family protein [Magnetococcales bacterium]